MSNKQPPFVIHVSELADYPDAVYIGRAVPVRKLARSKWANPYKIGKHGSGLTFTRRDVIRSFRCWMSAHPSSPSHDELSELTGKPLACWCRKSDEERTDDNACHGDVLVELWKERVGHE